MENEISNFCCNLKFLREKNKYSIEKMAGILKLKVSGLENIENGRVLDSVSCEVLFIVHKHFDVLPKDLFSRLLN